MEAHDPNRIYVYHNSNQRYSIGMRWDGDSRVLLSLAIASPRDRFIKKVSWKILKTRLTAHTIYPRVPYRDVPQERDAMTHVIYCLGTYTGDDFLYDVFFPVVNTAKAYHDIRLPAQISDGVYYLLEDIFDHHGTDEFEDRAFQRMNMDKEVVTGACSAMGLDAE